MTLETTLPPSTRERWTPEEDALLRQRIAENIPFALIANELGRPRPSCIGRANRLGIAHPTQPNKPLPRLPEPHKLPASVTEATPNNMNLVTLFDRAQDQCRYPYGDSALGEQVLFCGAPRAHKNYCAFHQNLCYRKWED